MSLTPEREQFCRDLLKKHDEERHIVIKSELNHAEYFRDLLNEIDRLRETAAKQERKISILEDRIGKLEPFFYEMYCCIRKIRSRVALVEPFYTMSLSAVTNAEPLVNKIIADSELEKKD